MRMDTSINTIDEFISNYPSGTQEIMQKIRAVVHKVAPDAKEKIGYGIPTFTLNGRNLVHFSAYEAHIGFYPGAAGVAAFLDRLGAYETSKGTIRFSLSQPIPYDLIEEITKYCVEQQPGS